MQMQEFDLDEYMEGYAIPQIHPLAGQHPEGSLTLEKGH